MTANQLVVKLIAFEMTGDNAPDARRVIRNERMTLQAVAQRHPMNREAVELQKEEALRVAKMWGVPGI